MVLLYLDIRLQISPKKQLEVFHQCSRQHQLAFSEAFSRKLCEFVSCLGMLEVRIGSKVRLLLTNSCFLSHTPQSISA